MSSLHGKTVVLTGAGGSLASVLAPVLREAGAKLVLVGHREGDLHADLTRPEEAARLADLSAFALVHSVGGFAPGQAAEANLGDARRMLALNFETLFNAVAAVLPGMLSRGEGRLVGFGAGQAVRGAGPGAALYTASKAAVAAYLGSLDAELKGQGVRTTVLSPMGAIDTPSNRAAGLAPERLIDPQDIAQSVVHVLTRSPHGHLMDLRIEP